MIRSREERPLRLRSKSMILEQLQQELMIYDPEQNKAFCLNHTAAFVWNRADGKTTVAEMAKSLGQHSDRPMPENEKLVGFALEVLAKDGLLVSSTVVHPAILGLTRRRMLQQLGVGAMGVPAVTALFLSPAKAHASSASSTIPSSDLPATTPNYGPGFWKWIEDLF
jgi:Coenzyme PQQ synthesis protein D (PqqD)